MIERRKVESEESELLPDNITEKGGELPGWWVEHSNGLCGLRGIVIWQYKGINARKEYLNFSSLWINGKRKSGLSLKSSLRNVLISMLVSGRGGNRNHWKKNSFPSFKSVVERLAGKMIGGRIIVVMLMVMPWIVF